MSAIVIFLVVLLLMFFGAVAIAVFLIWPQKFFGPSMKPNTYYHVCDQPDGKGNCLYNWGGNLKFHPNCGPSNSNKGCVFGLIDDKLCTGEDKQCASGADPLVKVGSMCFSEDAPQCKWEMNGSKLCLKGDNTNCLKASSQAKGATFSKVALADATTLYPFEA